MKYSMYLDAYVYKSPYPYYIVQADEWLTKFEVWSNRKTFNAWLYSEREVIAMIEAKYPGAERIGRIVRARKAPTPARKTYPAKQEFTPGRGTPPCVVDFPRVRRPPAQI